ncbi:hypothetical protein chiPu_0019393 [Chiloscyllium punctatum]|uniref:Uncharacterized protein n=1 Tax=Chiloscyllium punctatum TaxID=137246 RepID=A0A401RRR0_CHIPU|nr:hypothetical protein [Chiloscyllium punctatum]
MVDTPQVFGNSPYSSHVVSKSSGCFCDPLVEVCIQEELVSDGRAKVRKLTIDIVFAVIGHDDRQFLCVLSRVIVFFRVKANPKPLQA